MKVRSRNDQLQSQCLTVSQSLRYLFLVLGIHPNGQFPGLPFPHIPRVVLLPQHVALPFSLIPPFFLVFFPVYVRVNPNPNLVLLLETL